ncbi:MAG TPA: hypothetical protein PK256_26330, partial [Verrucomicrobiota bacterium]|nr:hypothetical protein [Verrucomicrobiota bacterium]
MTKAVLISFALLLAAILAVQAQPTAAQKAEEEAVRRQEATIQLRLVLPKADEALQKNDLNQSIKLYEEAWGLVQSIGPAGIDKERQQTMDGLVLSLVKRADIAKKQGNLYDADSDIKRALKVNPASEMALNYRKNLDKFMADNAGRTPSKEVMAETKEVRTDQVNNQILVQDGKRYFEMGKLDEAEAKLTQAFKNDPSNPAALHYLNLIQEARYTQEVRIRGLAGKKALLKVEEAWAPTVSKLGPANPFAKTNIIYTGPGRQKIQAKLEKIKLDDLKLDGLPLSEVVKYLDTEARSRDPEGKGINFIINSAVDKIPPVLQQGLIDPVTGAPTAGPPPEPEIPVGDVTIRISPGIRDVSLLHALDAICKVAEPILLKYSLEEYAVVFSRKVKETEELHTRVFKVDPNTFMEGLESVYGMSAVPTLSGGGGTGTSGGGIGGGGGFGGGGGGMGGGTDS